MSAWKATTENSNVPELLAAQLAHHPDLVLCEDEIAVIFKEKASKKGGQVVLGAAKKAPNLLSVLGDTDWKFILEIAYDEWQDLNLKQQAALLDHLLCGCGVEEDAIKGTTKYFLKPPDVAFYFGELERHGDWRPRPADAPDGDIVDLLTGNDPEASA